ncbi:DUF982 domain-containing protein [Phyllobacterium endophyticum]|uniref:DUF982 domain-containing protein n=1 Tax=Phyllobacterium endophyticum TaxID=1149773 RepID=A0A2P7AVK2_9HYPH|nr:DUF982 domain-containing protein [Phyllobacterium endophyticum]MBB3234788.1 hypothetical protein [Phyllobacterium endophyticum]PSH58227.1 DUF982 domain-containing protein [Phyllobacterium endophyticum]TYR38906.1 DUF982 domain-containing protein [Phyllobacterium endophyticum]
MKVHMFRKPVHIVAGLGYPARISTVLDAYSFLNDWTQPRPNALHSLALTACRAAFAGEIDAETARDAFVAFARKNDLLAPDVTAAIASNALKTPGNAPRAS